MKSIYLIIPTLTAGGAERMCVDLANELSKSCEITLITFDGRCAFTVAPEVKWVSLGVASGISRNPISVFRVLMRLRREMLAASEAVAFSFMERANILAYVACAKGGRSVVPTVHATVQSFNKRSIFARLTIGAMYRRVLGRAPSTFSSATL